MTNPRLPVSEGPSVVAADDLLEKHMLTPDPVARALAQVEREAREAATEPASKSLYVIATAAERDVWKAAAERALRALHDCTDTLRYARKCIVNEASGGGLIPEAAPNFARIDVTVRNAAACFPPDDTERRREG